MTDCSNHSFILAYKWWLSCDSYFSSQLRMKKGKTPLDETWVSEIGVAYQFARTIPEGKSESLANLLLHSGQGDGMPLEQRAARLSLAIERRDKSLKNEVVSAASKLSWFVWPEGWTMLDRYASKAVIGSPKGTSIEKMERFYAALAMRGWDDLLRELRSCLAKHSIPALLAERLVDKYLFLVGSDADERQHASIIGFADALPNYLRDEVYSVSEETGQILEDINILHRNNITERSTLLTRLEKLRQFKNEIA